MSRASPESRPIPAKHHKRHKLAGLVVVCLLLTGILLSAVFSTARNKWHCSPSQPRLNGANQWAKVIGPAQSPTEPNEDFFAGFAVNSDEENFLVEHPTEHLPDNPFDYEVRKMTPGQTLSIGGGTLTFCAVATAYLDAAQTMEDDAAYRFYDAGQRSMTREQAEELGLYQFTEPGRNFRYSPFPHVKFGFRYDGIDDLMFQAIAVFDASTRKEVAGGYSSSTGPAYHWYSTAIPLWHRTPVDIVIEVSYGPSKIFEFAPRAGEGFREGNFECRVICALDGVDVSRSSSTSGDKTVTSQFPKADPGEGGLRIVFACQPAASRRPVTFQFLDADGNVLSTRGGSTSGLTHSAALNHPLEKVARIRARYRTQRCRILIHLPRIPGLPEQNNAVGDLFDIYVPYVRLHDPGQAGQFLANTLQLNGTSRTGPPPPNSINSIRFPLEFTDVTIREIAGIYAEGGDLKVDIENERLRVEYPVPLGTWLKQFIQRIFQRNTGL